jgi:pyruvate formate lyase activating enzyme
MPLTGTIFHIERFAVHDGPGIRTTVFLKGCPMRCWWCHSPESQSSVPEPYLRGDRCIHCGQCLDACERGAIVELDGQIETLRAHCAVCGECAQACPSGARDIVGREVTVGELVTDLERDTPFFDRSGGGVTFSGGEPLMQAQFLALALGACRERGIHTAVETAGFAPWPAIEVAATADLVLFDLKLRDEARHRYFTGVSNGLILENLARLASTRNNVRVRIPLVPGVNDDAAEIDGLGRFLATTSVREIDVLPYHTAGIAKYRRLGREAPLPDAVPPTPADVEAACRRLEQFGLSVHVGG